MGLQVEGLTDGTMKLVGGTAAGLLAGDLGAVRDAVRG
jgi:hypothetical protein